MRENATLAVPTEEYSRLFVDCNSIIAFLVSPVKTYSLGVVLDEIIVGDCFKTELHVDDSIIGPFNEGEEVQVAPFNAPEAERIVLVLPSTATVPEGNWDTLLHDQLGGELLDDGSEFFFVYPSKLDPVMLNGVLEASIPLAPVVTSSKTRVMVKKYDQEELTDLQTSALQARAKRAELYSKQLEEHSLQFMSWIKSDQAARACCSFKFTADPESLYEGISLVFRSWRLMDGRKTRRGEDFLAGFDYLLPGTPLPRCVSEGSIIAHGDDGRIDLTVYVPPDSDPNPYLQDLEEKMRGLRNDLRSTPRTVHDKCPGCGHALDFEEADELGIVRCEGCNDLVKIPLRYRTR